MTDEKKTTRNRTPTEIIIEESLDLATVAFPEGGGEPVIGEQFPGWRRVDPSDLLEEGVHDEDYPEDGSFPDSTTAERWIERHGRAGATYRVVSARPSFKLEVETVRKVSRRPA